jgi:uncharacterized paraquat-inducible protein A
MMNQQHLRDAPRYALKNRVAIEESEVAGCYQCLAVFSTKDINEWTDWGQTALCPKCRCDCVLAQSLSIPLDEPTLTEIQSYWLGTDKIVK